MTHTVIHVCYETWSGQERVGFSLTSSRFCFTTKDLSPVCACLCVWKCSLFKYARWNDVDVNYSCCILFSSLRVCIIQACGCTVIISMMVIVVIVWFGGVSEPNIGPPAELHVSCGCSCSIVKKWDITAAALILFYWAGCSVRDTALGQQPLLL